MCTIVTYHCSDEHTRWSAWQISHTCNGVITLHYYALLHCQSRVLASRCYSSTNDTWGEEEIDSPYPQHTHIYMYTHIYPQHIYIYTQTYMHTYLCICLHIYIRVCVCTYVCVCMYIDTQTSAKIQAKKGREKQVSCLCELSSTVSTPELLLASTPRAPQKLRCLLLLNFLQTLQLLSVINRKNELRKSA